MKVTPHFSVEEFACRDEARTPYPRDWIDARLLPLCRELETIRAALGGRPITITSGYRTPEHNRRIGGARVSQHMAGRAADIAVRGLSAQRVHDVILDFYRSGSSAIRGLGAYPTFTHVDTRPGQRLARWNGTRTAA